MEQEKVSYMSGAGNRPPLPPKPAVSSFSRSGTESQHQQMPLSLEEKGEARSQNMANIEHKKSRSFEHEETSDKLTTYSSCTESLSQTELKKENEKLKLQLTSFMSEIEKYKQDLHKVKEEFAKREHEVIEAYSSQILRLNSEYFNEKKRMEQEIALLKSEIEAYESQTEALSDELTFKTKSKKATSKERMFMDKRSVSAKRRGQVTSSMIFLTDHDDAQAWKEDLGGRRRLTSLSSDTKMSSSPIIIKKSNLDDITSSNRLSTTSSLNSAEMLGEIENIEFSQEFTTESDLESLLSGSCELSKSVQSLKRDHDLHNLHLKEVQREMDGKVHLLQCKINEKNKIIKEKSVNLVHSSALITMQKDEVSNFNGIVDIDVAI